MIKILLISLLLAMPQITVAEELIISGLTEPIAEDTILSSSQTMQVIYTSGSEEPVWLILNGDHFDIYADRQIRAYSVSFLLDGADVNCRTYHQFDHRWSGGICPVSIPQDELFFISIYNAVVHATHLMSCSPVYKVSNGSGSSPLYRCVGVYTTGGGES